MPKFKVIKQIDAGSGFLHNSMGVAVSMQSLAPKIGSIISGTLQVRAFNNQAVSGIEYEIFADGSKRSSSLIFIPEECLEGEGVGKMIGKPAIYTPPSRFSSILASLPYIPIIGVTILIVTFFTLKHYKIIKL